MKKVNRPGIVMAIALLVLVLYFPIPAFPQKNVGSLKGKILTASGDLAVAVTVQLKKNGKMTQTDANGNFILQHLPLLQDTLVITSVASDFLVQAVNIKDGSPVDLGTITLSDKYEPLASVEIKGRSLKSYKSDYSYYGTKTQTAFKDIPQSISTVTKELIKDKMELTLKDAVDEVTGVNQYSGYEEYTIRGLRAENPHNINGLRGYNTSYTSNMLVNVERIEVVKGPTATLYGNCDPGGTINLVTKKPLDTKAAEISLFQGSWNHWRAQGDITGPLNAKKTILYRVNAGYDKSGSFRNQVNSESYQVAPSFTFIPNSKLQINLDLSLSHTNSVLDRGAPGFRDDNTVTNTPHNLSVSQPGDYLHETDLAAIATLSYKINKRLSFNTGLLNYITRQDVAEHGINNYVTNDSVSLFYHTWSYPTLTTTWTNYFTYTFFTGKLSHQLLAGYDYIRSELEPEQSYFELPDQYGAGSGIVGGFSLKNPVYPQRPVSTYQPSTYTHNGEGGDENIYQTHGIYIQDQVSLDRWKFLFSLREEMFRAGADGEEEPGVNVLLPRLGIVYAIKPNINIYGTYNKGFDPLEPTSTAQVFNEPFKPLISELLEFGVKGNFFRNKLAASIAAYQISLQNVAVNANDPANPNRYVQLGEVTSKGVETEIAGNILPNLSVMLSYAYCDAKVTKSKVQSQEGMILENAPKNTSSSWIKYVFTRNAIKGLGIAFGHSQVGLRNTLQSGLVLPGYIVFNAGLQYSFKHMRIGANLNNFTNQGYWTGAYNNVNKWAGAPRNYMINLGYIF
ncbi:TonB-dependent siderophore receptor [Flavihumibacter profundi]|uniref:TonB-dependent siderophore receptor n=1 Tax=Flavihumibacter profundi TaxID=2716883 RepID=UPI001CC6FA8F|nr:TonB-dependent siderophore receptor [Flavihumibacter profundi]MBZ5856926.1 TonB-dependent receptor [Flavihumibacter profundi]